MKSTIARRRTDALNPTRKEIKKLVEVGEKKPSKTSTKRAIDPWPFRAKGPTSRTEKAIIKFSNAS